MNESGKTLRAALTLPPCWLGNVPEGQEKQSDDIIQKLKLIYILSFQGPTASFAMRPSRCFFNHVTVSWDPLSS